MAMLAERRHRKRYNLVPKGKALFEDSDRFGTKMLEKMGWSKGKGLGRDEDGQQEFVRVRYKNDANGLGFEERDDQWTEHEKHFSGLLEKLNGEESAKNSASDEDDLATPTVGFGFEQKKVAKEKMKDKFSGQSLEEKSKNSKARVHYKKFTKGKDIAQYSEKDLANIFGKKATPNETDIYSQFTAYNTGKDGSSDESVKKPMELGTQTINTGVSVSDYFKMKMDALKKKNATGVVNGGGDVQDDESEEVTMMKRKRTREEEGIVAEVDEEAPKKKKKKKSKQLEEGNEEPATAVEENSTQEEGSTQKPSFELGTQMVNTGMSVSDYFKMKMEALQKKRSEPVVNGTEDHIESGENPLKKEVNSAENGEKDAEEPAEEVTEKKKKKKKQRPLENGYVDEQASLDGQSGDTVDQKQDETRTKKKKSKKAATEHEAILIDEQTSLKTQSGDSTEQNQEEIQSKKKKSKKADPITDEEPKKKKRAVPDESMPPSDDFQESSAKKKNKKKKSDDAIESIANDSSAIPSVDQVASDLDHETTDKSSKKKKTPTDQPQPADEQPKKTKKKHKSKQNPIPLPAVSFPVNLSKLKEPLVDTYTISTFCAEKFRNIEFPLFENSNLSQVNGYGLSEDLKLNIKLIKNDQQRIMQLWSGTLDKYQYATPKHKIYTAYMTKAKQARRSKTKIPKIKMKSLKRKHVFQGI